MMGCRRALTERTVISALVTYLGSRSLIVFRVPMFDAPSPAPVAFRLIYVLSRTCSHEPLPGECLTKTVQARTFHLHVISLLLSLCSVPNKFPDAAEMHWPGSFGTGLMDLTGELPAPQAKQMTPTGKRALWISGLSASVPFLRGSIGFCLEGAELFHMNTEQLHLLNLLFCVAF